SSTLFPYTTLFRSRVRVEGQRQALEMGQELSSQGVGELDPDSRGDVELAVRKRSPEDGDDEDGEGQDDERDETSAPEQSVEKRKGRRERFAEQDLIENQLQRPRREELGQREPEHADGGESKVPSHPAEVSEDDAHQRRAPTHRVTPAGATPSRSSHSSSSDWVKERRSTKSVLR